MTKMNMRRILVANLRRDGHVAVDAFGDMGARALLEGEILMLTDQKLPYGHELSARIAAEMNLHARQPSRSGFKEGPRPSDCLERSRLSSPMGASNDRRIARGLTASILLRMLPGSASSAPAPRPWLSPVRNQHNRGSS